MEQDATVIPVKTWVDTVIARSIASRIAAAAGFRPKTCQEIAIVVSELATNLVRHGGGGTLRLVTQEAELKITALDRGPGLGDIFAALQDHYSQGRMLVLRQESPVQADDRSFPTEPGAANLLRPSMTQRRPPSRPSKEGAQALEGGAPERSGLGCGLGAIQRLTDRMEIQERPGGGLCVCVWKRLPRENT